MGDEKKVSAVIITHNRLNMLKRALDSVFAQTYKNIEVVVVDDASDDDTADYLNGLEDRIRYIRIDKEDSKGGNHARNIGIKAAQGEFVALLDDDDEWLPAKIKKQMEVVKNHPDACFVGCGMFRRGVKGRLIAAKYDNKPQGDMKEYILCHTPYHTSTILARKDLLEEVGGFDEDLRYWQEFELQMRLFQKVKAYAVDERLMIYEMHSGTGLRLTSNYSEWKKNVEYINHKHANIIMEAGEDIRKKRELLIVSEGAMRAETAGLGAEKKKELESLFRLQPSLKNAIRKLLGFYSYKRLFKIL